MRDIAMIGLFAAAAVAALRNPYWGALLWVWIGLMNPHRLAYGFAHTLPFAMAAAALLMLAMAMRSSEVQRPRGGVYGVLLLFIVWMGLTSATAILRDASLEKYVEVLKVLGMAVAVACVVHTRAHIVGLAWVVTGSIAFYGVKGGIFTIATGGGHRVWGPTSSAVEENNSLAVALIMIIPLLYAMGRHAEVAREFPLVRFIAAKWLRRGLYASCLLCAASAIGSQSRGALLAIIAMALMLWWRSRSKAALGFVMLALVPISLSLMPDDWFNRMESIQTYEQDLSALQRLNAWQTAINIANDRVMGAGFATANLQVFGMYSPRPGAEWVYVAHSIYFQVLGDHGYIGLGLYLLLGLVTYRMAGRIISLTRSRADLAWAHDLASMSKVSIVGFAVGGAFLSLAYWDMPYYIPVVLAALERHVRMSTFSSEPAAAASAAQPEDSLALKNQ